MLIVHIYVALYVLYVLCNGNSQNDYNDNIENYYYSKQNYISQHFLIRLKMRKH